MKTQSKLQCPHCGEDLDEFEIPDQTGWKEATQWACFNDECPYYKEGWEWMWDNYQIHASYRFRVLDPDSATSSPLAVWSETAVRDRIVRSG